MTDACGCCDTGIPPTPATVENRPGLAELAYRVGTYGSFRASMLERIASSRELQGLTTRRDDDYAVALLDLWAAVGDVLAFYQERYADEAFLRTATRRESIARLARLLDYRLAPGAAATTQLVFSLDDGAALTIPRGVRVQSVPAEGARPQTFETIETAAADARLNRLRAYPRPTPIGGILANGATESTLDPVAGPSLRTALAPGARMIVFRDGGNYPPEQKQVRSTRVADDRVIVEWTEPVGRTWPGDSIAFVLGRTFRLFGHNAAPTWMEPSVPDASNPTRVVWNRRATIFAYPGGDSDESVAVESKGVYKSRLVLDGRYDGLASGQALLVVLPDKTTHRVTIIEVEQQVSDTVGPLTDTATRITVFPPLPAALGDRRQVTIVELGRQLTFSTSLLAPTFPPTTVSLPGRFVDDESGPGVEVGLRIEGAELAGGAVLRTTDLGPGRTVLLDDAAASSFPAQIAAPATIEPAAPAVGAWCELVLQLAPAGGRVLETSSAFLLGNVVAASHGETVSDEVVGSGDATAAFQRLPLRKTPLTYVPTGGAKGVEPALTVLVNGIAWKPVDNLYGQQGSDQVYVVRTQEDGTAALQFGDGQTGARLSTGNGNVHAAYRVGVGLAGRVGSGRLTTLLDRLVGLREVTNPLSATGGADPEPLGLARANAPQSVRTLGKVVSLRDFEDLAKASGEVAKAQATQVWTGIGPAVHLTVAGQDAGVFSATDLRRLGDTLTAARDPNHPLRVANYTPLPVTIAARVVADDRTPRATVDASARSALADALAFPSLALGGSLHLSDLYRILQDVPGVLYVDVDRLAYKRTAGSSNIAWLIFLMRHGAVFRAKFQPEPVQPRLRALRARPDPAAKGSILPAELLTVAVPAEDVELLTTGGVEG